MLQDFTNKLKNIKAIIKSDNFKTLIASGENREDFHFGNVKRPNFLALGNAYTNYSAFASLNLLSEASFGEGFTLDAKKEAVLRLCEPVQELRPFKPTFVDEIKDCYIYGTSAMENKWDDNIITGFKTININTIEKGIEWDNKGNIIGYTQKTGMFKSVKLTPEEVTLMRFFRKDDNVFGVGLIEPVYGLMEIRMDMFLAIKEIFQFLAMPPVHITKKGATKEVELKAAEKKWKNFHRKKYFITGEGWEVDMLQVKRALPDLSKYFEIVDGAISIGLRVPTKVLSGDMSYATKASALALREYSKDEIKYTRNKLKRILESQIYEPLCLKNGFKPEDVPKVIWNPDPPADPSVLNDLISKQIDTLTTLVNNDLVEKALAKTKITELVAQMKKIDL